MIRKRWLYVVAATAVTGLAVGSFAVASKSDGPPSVPQTTSFKATLFGYQEVPANSTTGFGDFRAKLVDDTTIHYVFRYAALEGGTSLFAHVHFGQQSVNGGVSYFLCGGSTKPTACPDVQGTIEGDITPADVVGPNGQGIEPGSFAEIVRAMRAGVSYVNIHTTRWPGGEIRGQINANDDGHDEDDDDGHRGRGHDD
jgi:hypothetical protein